MRLRIEATAEEVATRGDELARVVCDHLESAGLDLAKAAQAPAESAELADILSFPVMRRLSGETRKVYALVMARVLADAETILTRRSQRTKSRKPRARKTRSAP